MLQPRPSPFSLLAAASVPPSFPAFHKATGRCRITFHLCVPGGGFANGRRLCQLQGPTGTLKPALGSRHQLQLGTWGRERVLQPQGSSHRAGGSLQRPGSPEGCGSLVPRPPSSLPAFGSCRPREARARETESLPPRPGDRAGVRARPAGPGPPQGCCPAPRRAALRDRA